MNAILRRVILGICFLILCLFLLHKSNVDRDGTLEYLAHTIAYPCIWITGNIADTWNSWCTQKAERFELEAQNKKLKETYETVLTENIKLRAMLHHEALSKDLRDFQARYHLEDKLLAKILIKNITDEEHYFLINKGRKHGVKQDMVAIYKFQVVGKITAVHAFYSKVLLITDQTCRVAAYASTTHAEGILRGQNNIAACKLIYVNHLLSVVTNDIIVASGQGFVFPEGFSLGQIVSHHLPEKSLYHEIIVRPLINLQALNFVMLIDQAKLNIF